MRNGFGKACRSGWLTLWMCLVLTACQRSKAPFEVMRPADTGIRFSNTLHQADLFSILYYLYYYNGGGVAAGDVNNDGLTDLYFTANHPEGNKLYLNKGNFAFEDITAKAGVAGICDWSTGATMADVNGDGLLDIYVCAVGSQFGLTGVNELYINKGDLTFVPSAAAYGLNFSGLSTQSAFFDFDHDGDLDCYLLNHSKKPHANVVDTVNRRKVDPVSGDRLYRQDLVDGQIRFTDVSAQAGIYQSNLGYGLGLAIADFNNDGWEDIYVGNDFHENDYYYLNNGNGTFKEDGASHFRHYSRFSMGNDAADYNNDGQVDLITLDMLPPDEKTLKTYGSDENPNTYTVKIGLHGYQHQYSRNCLQHNNGNGVSFSETGLLSGVAATDWSWSPLFADFDNDGNKDLFISSGIVKRPVDLDYVQYVSAMQSQKGLDLTDKFDEETIAKMPDGSSHPFFFKGDGHMKFTDMSEAWGTAKLKGYFNGAAYADLDNDGDLDVVINNIDAPATVLRNNHPAKKHLSLSFKGSGSNTFGVGAKAYVFAGGRMQFLQLMPTRGFQSASEPRLHFGLDTLSAADSLVVVWPGQQCQWLKNIAAGTELIVKQENAHEIFDLTKILPPATPLLVEADIPGIPWRHQENEFLDFNRQYLIPHVQSTRGPKMAVADVNRDGLEDFYICGASGQAGALMLQTRGGGFAPASQATFAGALASEEVDALFFDANKDGAPDLVVVSGGNELDSGAAPLADHLYLNDGSGGFSPAPGALPTPLVNKSSVAAADVDHDGDEDLFIGGLAHTAKYGLPQSSYLLMNDGRGHFSLAGAETINLHDIGMCTAAQFGDLNGDGWADLVVTGEWMPVKVYMNQHGRFTPTDLPGSTGLWQCLLATDVNGDGKTDLLAGNWGLNTKYHAGKSGPLKLYVKDFDNNGTLEQVVAYTMEGKEYTFLAKDELERPLPVLKKAYLTYSEVAGKTVQYMFYDLFKGYLEWKAETLASAVFLNEGNGRFSRIPLPDDLQLAPIFAFVPLPGTNTYATGGNFYGVVPYEGRYDGLLPSLFSMYKGGKSVTVTASLPALEGEVRDMKWIRSESQLLLVIARNNHTPTLFRLAQAPAQKP